MAFYLTYDSLTEKLLEYLNRSDEQVVQSIPMFIMLGERRVSRDLKILGLLKFVEGNLLPSNPYLPKQSSRWLKTNSLFVGYNKPYKQGYNTRKPLFNRDQAFCETYWPDLTQTGLPEYYADFEYTEILIVPVPDQPYKYWMSFYEVPVLIDSQNSTNFLTDYNPDLLISACMVEALLYLKNYSWATQWEQKYKESVASTSHQNVQLMTDSNTARGT